MQRIIREWPEWNKRIKHAIGITHPRFYASLKLVPRLRFDLYQSKSWAADEYQWEYHINFGFLSFRIAIMKSCFAWSYFTGADKPGDMNKYRIVYVDTQEDTSETGYAHCYRHAVEIARDMPLSSGRMLRGYVLISRREDPRSEYKSPPMYGRFFDWRVCLRR